MKNIQAKSIWIKGEEKNAELIDVFSSFDNLHDKAILRYKLSTIDLETLNEGSIVIEGEEYLLWGVATDINLSAYEYVVGKLNLVLA